MGRGVGFWLFFGAYTGAAIGGASIAGFTGMGFDEGISSFWILLVSGFTVPLFAWLFGGALNRFGRERSAFTLSDFLVHRYGEALRRPAMFITYLRPAFITGLQFLAIGTLLRVGFGLDTASGVLLGATIVLGYTLVGGQYSAITSQWLQSLLQGLGMLLFLVFAVSLHGGVGQAGQAMVTHLPAAFLDVYSADFSWMSVWLISMGVFYFVDPWLFQWAYMAKDPRTSRNALVAAAVASPWGAVSFLGGMLIAAAVLGGQLDLPADTDPDLVYLTFVQNHLSLGPAALLLVAYLMTVLSCASSFLMNGATILKSDLLDTVLGADKVKERPLLTGRVAILATAAFGVVAALWVPVLVPLWIIGQSIAVSGLFWPVMAAWFWPRATAKGALWSMTVGGLTSFAWALWAWHSQGSASSLIMGLHAAHVGMATSLVAMVAGSLLTGHGDSESVDATSWRRLWAEPPHEEVTG
jgi:SSS family solute:Na+ symporter